MSRGRPEPRPVAAAAAAAAALEHCRSRPNTPGLLGLLCSMVAGTGMAVHTQAASLLLARQYPTLPRRLLGNTPGQAATPGLLRSPVTSSRCALGGGMRAATLLAVGRVALPAHCRPARPQCTPAHYLQLLRPQAQW